MVTAVWWYGAAVAACLTLLAVQSSCSPSSSAYEIPDSPFITMEIDNDGWEDARVRADHAPRVCRVEAVSSRSCTLPYPTNGVLTVRVSLFAAPGTWAGRIQVEPGQHVRLVLHNRISLSYLTTVVRRPGGGP